MFTYSVPVGLMSGENPRYQSAPGGQQALKRDLDSLGAQYEETRGHYGLPERSLIVYGLPREHLAALGKKYGQESVIHNENGQRHFLYTNGPQEGQWHTSLPGYDYERWPEGADEPDDNWTQLPGDGYVRLNFDFDHLHQPSPALAANSGAPVPQGLTKSEVGHAIYQMVKDVLVKAGDLIQFPAQNPKAVDYTRRIEPRYQDAGYTLGVVHEPKSNSFRADLRYKGKHAATIRAPYVEPGKIGAVEGIPEDGLSQNHPLYENMVHALRHRAHDHQFDRPGDLATALHRLVELNGERK